MIVVIGLGTGRCGTTSLVGLLSSQHGAFVTHQRTRMLWQGDYDLAMREAESLVNATDLQLTGDVAFYWLPYVYQVSQRFPQIKFVCLRRSRLGYEESWAESQGCRNAWMETGERLDLSYPQFGLPQSESIQLYWDNYFIISSALARQMPDRFRVFPLRYMNTKDGQRAILEFIGVSDHVLKPGIRLNKRGTSWEDRFKE